MILQMADNGLRAEVGVTQLKAFIPLTLETTAPWSVCPGYGEECESSRTGTPSLNQLTSPWSGDPPGEVVLHR